MANYEVRVNEDQFRGLGIDLRFDKSLYGELLDVFCLSATPLKVHIAPHPIWRQPAIGKLNALLFRREELARTGQYDVEDRIIDVFCLPSASKANRTLLHETKHYIDDTTGQLERGIQSMQENSNNICRGSLLSGIAMAGTLAAIGGDPMFGALAVAPALPLMHRAYWKSSHEIAAREFAHNPEISQAYGDIITYRPV